MLSPEFAPTWTESEISTDGLCGTLTLPLGASAIPAVLLLAGSGPVNRDGNLPGLPNDSLKLLAHALAAQGIASLRVDKRGVGSSQVNATREQDLRFTRYVDDALAWRAVLASLERISAVFLLGHSEGALVATMAAQGVQGAQVAGLILVAGAGEAAPKIIARQLAAAGVPPALQEASLHIAACLCQGDTTPNVPAELAQFYRPSIMNYLASWFTLDPANEFAKTCCPALIVQGSTDLQVGVADAHRLAAARPDATLCLVEGMNHILKMAPMDRAANLQTYSMPQLPLAQALVEKIVSLIRSAEQSASAHR